MSTEHNKQLVLCWKEERNQGNVNVVGDLCTPDFVLHRSGLPTPGPVRGRQACKHLFAAYLAAFAFQSMPPRVPPLEVFPEGELQRRKAPCLSKSISTWYKPVTQRGLRATWRRTASCGPRTCLCKQPGAPAPLNRAQSRMFAQAYLTAFPDAHLEVTLLIAQGNYDVTRSTATGTHTGTLRTPTGNAIPATGKQVVMKASETHELKGGKIVRSSSFADLASLLGQLGVMPPMEPSSAAPQDALVGEPAVRSTGGERLERLADTAVTSNRRSI